MSQEDRFKELDPAKIIEEMREEYWREISDPEAEVEQGRDQVLVVELSGEKFALPAINCKTIIKSGRTTRVPRLPAYMLGVVNLRGQIISVVDLGLLLGLPGQTAGAKSRLVVAESEGVRTAFLVDQVLGIEMVEHSRLREAEGLQTTVKSEYLRGHVAPLKDEPWMTFLDLDKIIHGPDLFLGRK